MATCRKKDLELVLSLHKEGKVYFKPMDICTECAEERLLFWNKEGFYWKHTNEEAQCKSANSETGDKLLPTYTKEDLEQIFSLYDEDKLYTIPIDSCIYCAGVRCLSCNQDGLYWKHINNNIQCISDKKEIRQDDEEIDTYNKNLTFKEIAVKLGFFGVVKAYASESRRLVDEATRGKYLPDEELWSVKSRFNTLSKEYISIWSVFIQYQMCLKCKVQIKDIIDDNPYCDQCFLSIGIEERKDNYSGDRTSLILSKRKEELSSQLEWLQDIPEEWEPGKICYFCEEKRFNKEEYKHFWEPGKDWMEPFVCWNRKKKSCCTMCLEDQCRKRGIIK
jgi:hypothetical protein